MKHFSSSNYRIGEYLSSLQCWRGLEAWLRAFVTSKQSYICNHVCVCVCLLSWFITLPTRLQSGRKTVPPHFYILCFTIFMFVSDWNVSGQIRGSDAEQDLGHEARSSKGEVFAGKPGSHTWAISLKQSYKSWQGAGKNPKTREKKRSHKPWRLTLGKMLESDEHMRNKDNLERNGESRAWLTVRPGAGE